MSEKPTRKYFVFYKAWYADTPSFKNQERKIVFGRYCKDGSTTGEMAMTWYPPYKGFIPYPRLEVFFDAWKSLQAFSDVIDSLAENDRPITPDQFAELLDGLGFEDATPYENPNSL